MIKLLTIESEEKSAKQLGFETYLEFPSCIEDWDNDVVIRWGLGSPWYNKLGFYQEFKNIINKQEAISLNCNKPAALAQIAKFTNTPKIYNKFVPKGEFAVYRSRHHAGGKGFKVKEGPFEIERGMYATQYLNADYEVRVFWCGDATIAAERISSKKSRINAKYKCRSLWPYKFWKKVPNDLHKVALAAKNAIGLDVGGSDILCKDEKYYILENNSAITVDSVKIYNFYYFNLLKLIKQKYPHISIK